jgi:hypothetical protein
MAWIYVLVIASIGHEIENRFGHEVNAFLIEL